MLSPLASVLRLASVVLCLIVIASFALFVVDQTGSASAHQQAIVNAAAPGSTVPAAQAPAASSKRDESSARKTIDEASEAITSPFSFATEATSSEWLSRAIGLLLALFFYGFVLGFVTRMIRVRL